MVMDARGQGRPRRMLFRPIYMWGAALLLLFMGAAVDHWLVQRLQTASNSLLPQYMHSQRLLRDAQARLAAAEAELSLRQERLTTMQEEMASQQQDNERLQERMRVYETILQSRKTSGVRILKAEASWLGMDSIRFDVVLVKGGNYPRRASGSLRIMAKDSHGRESMVKAGGDSADLSYEVESHAFLHGYLKWQQDWRPDRLLIIRLNRQGELRDQMEVQIRGGA